VEVVAVVVGVELVEALVVVGVRDVDVDGDGGGGVGDDGVR